MAHNEDNNVHHFPIGKRWLSIYNNFIMTSFSHLFTTEISSGFGISSVPSTI